MLTHPRPLEFAQAIVALSKGGALNHENAEFVAKDLEDPVELANVFVASRAEAPNNDASRLEPKSKPSFFSNATENPDNAASTENVMKRP